MIKIINWPRRAKTCLRAYADSEGPDQHVHSHSLIRALAARKQDHLDTLKCPNSEQMPG